MSEPSTPASLLERLKGPDEHEAWARFRLLYAPLIERWAGKFGVPPADRDDVVQEVFATLAQKLPAFTYDSVRGRFRGYLRTVAQSRAADWHRRAPHTVSLPADIGAPDAARDDLEEAEYRDLLVRRAVEIMRAEFEPVTWKAFWEYVVEERPPAEVAAELNLSVESVYAAKTRVLRTLRRELDGLLD
jgi:RNA polymerase sigma-70 factor, ECF subfamily